MKKIGLFFTLFTIILPATLFAQVRIKGKIFDNNNTPVEFAETQLLTKDSIAFKSELSNEQGYFSIETKKGVYILLVRQLGKILFSKQLDVSENLDLGLIKVETSQILQEVVVEGKKKLIEKKIDRLVFNVASSISASSGDALDALRVVPRVKVQNDKIGIIGKSELLVMVDDRLIRLSGDDLISFLKTIKSENIESIEVITNPSSKYNAQGNSGLINIKLKKAKNDSWAASIRSIYKQATYSTGNSGVNFNYQKNKLTLSSDFNYIKGSIAPIETKKIYYLSSLWSEENNRIDYSKSVSARMDVEYKLSPKITFGLRLNTLNNSPNVVDDIKSEIINNDSQKIDSVITTKAEKLTSRISNIFNFHFAYLFDSIGKKITLDFDHFDYANESSRLFQTNIAAGNNDTYSSANNIGSQKVGNYSFNVDMEHPTRFMVLNYGGRISFSKTNNTFKYFDLDSGVPVLDTKQSNEFVFDENTEAVYLSAQKEINKKWSAKLGVRLENTHTKGNSITLNQENTIAYIKLFPTAYLTYAHNDNNSFSLNYGKRIGRPSFSQLNPFKWVSSPYSYSEGNPYLLPSFTDNIEFEHSYKDILISSIYFSRLSNGFEELTIVDRITKIQQSTPKNFIENNMVGINESINLEPYKWLRVNFFLDVYYSSTKSTTPVTLNLLQGWNGEATISNDLILNKNKTLLFNMTYNYTTEGVDNLDRNTAFSQLDLSLKCSFIQKKLQIALIGNDILRTNRPEYIGYSNQLLSTFKNYYDFRFVRLSLSFKMGGKIKSISNRTSKNEDEIGRSQK
jgi:hypothetical protein